MNENLKRYVSPEDFLVWCSQMEKEMWRVIPAEMTVLKTMEKDPSLYSDRVFISTGKVSGITVVIDRERNSVTMSNTIVEGEGVCAGKTLNTDNPLIYAIYAYARMKNVEELIPCHVKHADETLIGSRIILFDDKESKAKVYTVARIGYTHVHTIDVENRTKRKLYLDQQVVVPLNPAKVYANKDEILKDEVDDETV